MMDKYYDTLEDTTPHEQHLLILSESCRCYGSHFSDLARKIKDQVIGNELTVWEQYHPLDDLMDNIQLIENSVWLIHWEECLENEDYPYLKFILKSSDFPNAGEAIICTEDGGREKAKEIKTQYKGTSAAYSEDSLLSVAEARLGDINPIHRRGKEKLKEWNNEVWDTVKR